jgi:hypothetical protein
MKRKGRTIGAWLHRAFTLLVLAAAGIICTLCVAFGIMMTGLGPSETAPAAVMMAAAIYIGYTVLNALYGGKR